MLVVAAVAGAITLAAAMFPPLEFVHQVLALHVAFQTAGALIGLLAGFLIAGRFLRRARLNELALVCSLGVLALSELAFGTVTVGPGSGSRDLTVWAGLGGHAIGALLFAAAVFLPDRRVGRKGLAICGAAGLVALTPLVIAAVAVSFAPRLPGVTVASTGLALPAGTDPGANAVLLRSELGLTMVYGLAAAGFLRHAERAHDEFSGWLAVAAILAGASHLNFFLYPTMYSQLVSLGDVFRLSSYAVLLAGSAREISSYWQALPQAAAQEERRRIASDLHDGLTKELGYLLTNLGSLDGAVSTATGADLLRAAERAQVAARLAISRLACNPGERVNVTISSAGNGSSRQHWLRIRPRGRGLVPA
jgi:signal transduction histidine kinase